MLFEIPTDLRWHPQDSRKAAKIKDAIALHHYPQPERVQLTHSPLLMCSVAISEALLIAQDCLHK